jgi:enamine deaminase RidA (YjgF/YER057c/UK114 family)
MTACTHETNPFPETDPDRHALWEMLVRRDIDAFLAADWDAVACDFDADRFFGVDAGFHANPDSWRITFPSLDAYRDAWLEQSKAFRGRRFKVDPRQSLFEATTLRDIEISGDRALLHKKFDGALHPADATVEPLVWQTLYQCRKDSTGTWRILGFIGYMPNPMPVGGSGFPAAVATPKRLPEGSSQHQTAGPYSPVLEIDPGKIVVISGQAAINPKGEVVGDDIETQTAYTLENCRTQLANAGCDFRDVFKVNVYLTDLDEWPRFNEVYARLMPEPRPVRTAVGTKLLLTLKVEVEMWAVKKS